MKLKLKKIFNLLALLTFFFMILSSIHAQNQKKDKKIPANKKGLGKDGIQLKDAKDKDYKDNYNSAIKFFEGIKAYYKDEKDKAEKKRAKLLKDGKKKEAAECEKERKEYENREETMKELLKYYKNLFKDGRLRIDNLKPKNIGLTKGKGYDPKNKSVLIDKETLKNAKICKPEFITILSTLFHEYFHASHTLIKLKNIRITDDKALKKQIKQKLSHIAYEWVAYTKNLELMRFIGGFLLDILRNIKNKLPKMKGIPKFMHIFKNFTRDQIEKKLLTALKEIQFKKDYLKKMEKYLDKDHKPKKYEDLYKIVKKIYDGLKEKYPEQEEFKGTCTAFDVWSELEIFLKHKKYSFYFRKRLDFKRSLFHLVLDSDTKKISGFKSKGVNYPLDMIMKTNNKGIPFLIIVGVKDFWLEEGIVSIEPLQNFLEWDFLEVPEAEVIKAKFSGSKLLIPTCITEDEKGNVYVYDYKQHSLFPMKDYDGDGLPETVEFQSIIKVPVGFDFYLNNYNTIHFKNGRPIATKELINPSINLQEPCVFWQDMDKDDYFELPVVLEQNEFPYRTPVILSEPIEGISWIYVDGVPGHTFTIFLKKNEIKKTIGRGSFTKKGYTKVRLTKRIWKDDKIFIKDNFNFEHSGDYIIKEWGVSVDIIEPYTISCDKVSNIIIRGLNLIEISKIFVENKSISFRIIDKLKIEAKVPPLGWKWRVPIYFLLKDGTKIKSDKYLFPR